MGRKCVLAIHKSANQKHQGMLLRRMGQSFSDNDSWDKIETISRLDSWKYLETENGSPKNSLQNSWSEQKRSCQGLPRGHSVMFFRVTLKRRTPW